MRLVALVSLLALSAACSSGLAPTTSVVVTLPDQPVQSIKLLSVTKILAFGDSLTEGGTGSPLPPVDPSTPGFSHSYPYKLQQLLNAAYPTQTISVFNGGMGGTLATSSTDRLQQLISQFSPQVMILMDGANDFNQGASVTAVVGGMASMVDLAQSRGVFVFLSAQPRQRDGGQRAGGVAQIVPYNAALSQMATTRAIPFVDIYPLITVEMLQPDGLHLTETANAALAAAYFAVIKAQFEYSAPK